MDTIALYAHIPFCAAKCNYCSFNSYAGLEALHRDYLQALCTEVARSSEVARGHRAGSIYVGGGTPTVLDVGLLGQVLLACTRSYSLLPGAEITVEANPGTVDRVYLSELRSLGVNRLSLGVQSFAEPMLALLGRIHTGRQATDTFLLARDQAFDSINLDLIYGLPGQGLSQWLDDLGTAIELGPDHLSLYCLSLDEGTALARSAAAGDLPEQDADLAAAMYERAEARLDEAGYVHYEISNWALPGHDCRHNLSCWQNLPYLGFGAGAHSFDGQARFWNVSRPDEYVGRVERGESPVAGREPIDQAAEMSETLILGLRLCRGVHFVEFEERFGVPLGKVFGRQIRDLAHLGLLDVDAHRVRLTNRGRLLGNEVFEYFLPEAGD